MDSLLKGKGHLLLCVQIGIFLLLFTPLFFWKDLIFYYVSTKVHFVLLVTELTSFVYCWLIWKEPRWRPKGNALSIALFVFLGISVFASLIGVDPFFSFWSDVTRSSGILMWMHLGAIFIIASSVLKTSEDWFRIFLVSTFIALLVVIPHLLSLVGMNVLVNVQSGSTFGNSTFFGTYLLFQAFFCLYLLFQAKTPSTRAYAFFAFFVIFLGLMTIQAYTAKISFFGGLVLFGALSLVSLGRARWKKGIGFALLGGLIVAFMSVAFFAFQSESIVHKTVVEYSSESRFVVWNMAWQAIRERPFFGWGLENFEAATVKFFDPCLGSSVCGKEIWFDKAHNIFLDITIEVGFIGLLAYLSLCGVALFHLWNPRSKSKRQSIIPVIFTTILVVYLVQNLTALDTVTSLLFFSLLLSAISSFGDEMTQRETSLAAQPQHKPVPAALPILMSLVFPVTFFFFVIQPIQGNRGTLQAIAPQAAEQHLHDYQRSLTVSPMGIDRRRTFLAHSTSTFLWDVSEESLGRSKEFAQQEVNLVVKALQDTIGRSSNNLPAHIALGMLYQVDARLFNEKMFGSAEQVLNQAIELSPHHQSPKWALASVYLEQGKVNEAVELTQEALALNSNVFKSHVFYIIALKFLGDDERLQQAVEQTKEEGFTSDEMSKIEQLNQMDNLEALKLDLLFQFFL